MKWKDNDEKIYINLNFSPHKHIYFFTYSSI